MLMRSTEVDIIIEDGSTLMGIVQKFLYLWTNDGVQRIIAAKKYDVVFVDFRITKVQTVVGMVFIENVFCIVLLVEESQREWRL